MVNVAIIGAGFMGSMHAQAYANLKNVKLDAIADTDIRKARELAEEHEATAYGQPQKVLDEKSIDVVDICLPTFLHKEWVVRAARSGKHILCEKPIALTIRDADEMIEACESARVEFMVGQACRFLPEYVRLKEIYDKKELGDLLSIICSRLGVPPNWGWNNWFDDPRRSGGAIIDLHIHDTDFLLYLIGRPVEVFSRMPEKSLDYGHIFTTYTFSGGIVATAEGGWDVSGKFPFTVFFRALFEQGTVEYSNLSKRTLVVYEQDKEPVYPEIKVEELEKSSSSTVKGNVSEIIGYFLEIKYFVNCLEENQRPSKAEGKEARESLRVVLAERQSAESGKIIRL